jgi:two-component system, NtrC family, response regulator AtoC
LCGISRNMTERKKIEYNWSDEKQEYPSEAMRTALNRVRMAAERETTILLLGESGAGKDFMARYIHDHSKRVNGPFFAINCAAVASELAESELFGHERGAFTGAHGRKRGLLELAEGGTLLLNEIGELSLALQAKLLSFLDTRQFTRVGGEKNISVNARLITATNRHLEKEVEAGRFRQDLYYRLNVISITVPPLRDRREDIPILVREIVSRLRAELQLAEMPEIDQTTMNTLTNYDWPGNVRELRNVLERALMLSDGQGIYMSTLGLGKVSQDWSYTVSFPSDRSLNDVTREMKTNLVNEALRRSGGSRQGAARLLGISRYSLKHYMNALDIHWNGDDE